jgi:aminopeptidase N
MLFRQLPGLIAALFIFNSEAHEMFCAGTARGAAPVDSPDYRKYPPERFVDIVHVAIDVTPDFKQRSVSGQTKVRFRPLRSGLMELKLNAVDLRVRDVSSTARIQAYQNTDSELVIVFASALPENAEQDITVQYDAFPQKGLYFRTAEMGYLPEDEHLFTQGEDIEARHWFPCYDSPNEKFTSEVICRIPEGMTVLSNGKLHSEQPMGNGLKAVHWIQDKPHVSYLICLVAGNLKKIEDKYRDIPLAFYTPASQIELAQNSFAQTREMMEFFEKEIGVPYPWQKYYQVCIQDFMWGGMENTSITTLTDGTLFPAETENIRSSQGLVAHELAHQWFGDFVTCKDWSQLWLNEGFATYYAHLYSQFKNGQEDFLYGLYNSARAFINRTSAEDSRPVVFRKYDQPTELFGYLVYPKGAWVLHMLRNELGADLYRRCIQTYLQTHQFSTVETHDLIRVIEEVSGRSLTQFFDQWIFHPHFPEVRATYAWDEKQKLARISIAQVQQLTNEISLFKFPLTVRFKGTFGSVERVLSIAGKQHDFFVPLDAAPQIVRLDPDYTLLARINFELPRSLLIAQLKDETDVMGRILALDQLGKLRDVETVKLISARLNNDSFFGVRLEAARVLRLIQTPDALQALIAASKQEDARVRQRVALEIGNFFDPAAVKFAVKLLEEEKNPDIRNQAIRALGAYPGPEHDGIIRASLRNDTYRNSVTNAAFGAIRELNDPKFIPDMIAVLEERPASFTARNFSDGLQTVAHLAQAEERKDTAYQFILKHVTNPRLGIKIAALNALGTLRDERGIPVLSSFASGAKDAPETAAAVRALEAIRANRSTGTEMQSLRTETLELKRQNSELKKSVDELTKRFDAVVTAPAEKRRPLMRGKR